MTNNPSTPAKRPAKHALVYTDAKCEYSMKQIPVSQAKINRMIEDLETWAERHPNAKAMHEFYYAHNLSKDTFTRICSKSPSLKEAKEVVQRKLGFKMWGKAVENKANFNAVKYMLHQYADDFKEADSYHANLNKKEETALSSAPQYIIVEKLPSSDLVPLKKEEIDV